MTNLYRCSLLETLLSRGDHIGIIKGKLVITPASKLNIPKQWLADKGGNLVREIAKLYDLDVYIFDSYSTGHYGKHNSAGVTLQFINTTTGEQCHITFNAELKRSRTTPKGKKGSNLPKGQFRIGKKYMFYKFWLATKLSLPPRLSAFHDYMGNLKQLYFVPNVDYKNKVIDKIIPLLNIEHSEILNRITSNAAYNNQTSSIQQPYNKHTSMPNSDLVKSHVNKGLTRNQTTCSNNYELSKQGSTVISNPLPKTNYNKKPHEQTTDEWLNDWEQA
jgi:hypothetical protein